MDMTEVIADAIRREVDMREVVRELVRQVRGAPFYTWEDKAGVKRGGPVPPADAVNLRCDFPSNKERQAAAQAILKAAAPQQVDHRHRVEGVPQRTPMDQWLDGLTAADMDRMFGTPPPAEDVEVEPLEATMPAAPAADEP